MGNSYICNVLLGERLMPLNRGSESTATGSVGEAVLKDYSEYVNAHGTVTSTTDIDCNDGNIHTITLGASITFTISNAASGDYSTGLTLVLTQDGTGSRTVTWPASVAWQGGAAPTLSSAASAVDVITLFTVDNGTTWYAFLAGSNMS